MPSFSLSLDCTSIRSLSLVPWINPDWERLDAILADLTELAKVEVTVDGGPSDLLSKKRYALGIAQDMPQTVGRGGFRIIIRDTSMAVRISENDIAVEGSIYVDVVEDAIANEEEFSVEHDIGSIREGEEVMQLDEVYGGATPIEAQELWLPTYGKLQEITHE